MAPPRKRPNTQAGLLDYRVDRLEEFATKVAGYMEEIQKSLTTLTAIERATAENNKAMDRAFTEISRVELQFDEHVKSCEDRFDALEIKQPMTGWVNRLVVGAVVGFCACGGLAALAFVFGWHAR